MMDTNKSEIYRRMRFHINVIRHEHQPVLLLFFFKKPLRIAIGE